MKKLNIEEISIQRRELRDLGRYNDIHRTLILGKRNKQDKKETIKIKWMIGELRKTQNKGMRGL